MEQLWLTGQVILSMSSLMQYMLLPDTVQMFCRQVSVELVLFTGTREGGRSSMQSQTLARPSRCQHMDAQIVDSRQLVDANSPMLKGALRE